MLIPKMTHEEELLASKCQEDRFSYEQMEQVYYGFINGLSIEQIKIYAKKEFNYKQMLEIRLGFHNSLTIEKVSFYARSDFNFNQMYKIRHMLLNEPLKKVREKVALMLLES